MKKLILMMAFAVIMVSCSNKVTGTDENGGNGGDSGTDNWIEDVIPNPPPDHYTLHGELEENGSFYIIVVTKHEEEDGTYTYSVDRNLDNPFPSSKTRSAVKSSQYLDYLLLDGIYYNKLN